MRVNDLFQYLIMNQKIDTKIIEIKKINLFNKKNETTERHQLKDLYANLAFKVRPIFFDTTSAAEQFSNSLIDAEVERERLHNVIVIEKIPKVYNTKYASRLFSPYNFKSGRKYSTMLSMILFVNLIFHLFIGHVIVGDDFTLFSQIGNSIISYKQLILHTILIILIILEFFVDNKRSFHWYSFYNFEQTTRLPFSFPELTKQLEHMINRNVDISAVGELNRS